MGSIFTATGILAIAGTCAIVQTSASLGYDEALDQFQEQRSEATALQNDLESDVETLETTTASASVITANDSGTLVDAASRDALATAIADAATVAADAGTTAESSIPQASEKPFWAWELFGATTELEEDERTAEERAAAFESSSGDLEAASTSVEDAAVAAMQSAVPAASAFEAAHISARNLDVIALRDAAEDLELYSTALDDDATSSYTSLEAAAAQVLVSEQAELAEKAGPLQTARLEIEAFARGLAPGVLLEFDWAPIVNGFGTDGGMGGYATWWYADPGYATIELSNSVAEQWPSYRSQSLVAHEVGHAISVKCEGMYDDSTQASVEAWATAWAISMGYTDDANGTWAYGAPPQSLIDTAAGCR